MQIVSPDADDLKACLTLEQQYGYDQAAAGEGFFLPGASLQLYEMLNSSGYVRLIKDGGRVLAFVAAIPPRHDILGKLIANHDAFVLHEPAGIGADNTAWIAKIATAPDSKRGGLATKLYLHVFESFKNNNILTATAREPLRNIPSENFHKHVGMVECGVYYGVNKDTQQKTVNAIWKYVR